MMQPVRFIVNADDLGRSETINRAIFDGIADRVISSSTIMSAGEAFDSAVQATKEFRAASFGVHLNLTEGRPVTRSPHLRALLDSTGDFRRGAVYEVRWTKALVDAVAEEWTAQVEQARRAGVALAHLDSHHHVHTLPRLFVALKRVQRRTGIRRVRGTWSIYDRAHAPPRRLRFSKAIWWWGLRRVHATKTTSELCDLLMFQRAVAEGSFAPRVWPSSIELMVHPGGDFAEENAEAAALRNDWMKALPVPARLASYRDL